MREYADHLLPLCGIKKKTLLPRREIQTRNQKIISATKSIQQHEERRCANEYWINLCREIQATSEIQKAMHCLLKTALGPAITQLAILKTEDYEPTEDQAEQLERWVEHCSRFYAQDLPEHPGMEAVLPSFGVYTELNEDPTEEELSEAISTLSNGKAPGEDGIPAVFLRKRKMFISRSCMPCCCDAGDNGKYHTKCGTTKALPVHKKGEKGDCNDHREYLSFLWLVRSSPRVLLKRLQRLADRILPETQSGFRAGRLTTDMVFTLC